MSRQDDDYYCFVECPQCSGRRTIYMPRPVNMSCGQGVSPESGDPVQLVDRVRCPLCAGYATIRKSHADLYNKEAIKEDTP